MKSYNAEVTIYNIKNHFKKSGLTIEVFANILEMSTRWLEYIFAGTDGYEFSNKEIQRACNFFKYDFGKFTTELQIVPNKFREELKFKHARNSEYMKILSDAPSVPFIIDEILVKDNDFVARNDLRLKEVKAIILRYYPALKLTNLSSDLRKSELIDFKLDTSKIKKTYLYSLRK